MSILFGHKCKARTIPQYKVNRTSSRETHAWALEDLLTSFDGSHHVASTIYSSHEMPSNSSKPTPVRIFMHLAQWKRDNLRTEQTHLRDMRGNLNGSNAGPRYSESFFNLLLATTTGVSCSKRMHTYVARGTSVY